MATLHIIHITLSTILLGMVAFVIHRQRNAGTHLNKIQRRLKHLQHSVQRPTSNTESKQDIASTPPPADLPEPTLTLMQNGQRLEIKVLKLSYALSTPGVTRCELFFLDHTHQSFEGGLRDLEESLEPLAPGTFAKMNKVTLVNLSHVRWDQEQKAFRVDRSPSDQIPFAGMNYITPTSLYTARRSDILPTFRKKFDNHHSNTTAPTP